MDLDEIHLHMGKGIANEIHEPGVPPVYRKNRRYLPFLANRSKVDQKSYCSQQSGVCEAAHHCYFKQALLLY